VLAVGAKTGIDTAQWAAGRHWATDPYLPL